MRMLFPGITHARPGGAETLVVDLVRHAHAVLGIPAVLMGSRDAFVVRRLNELAVPHTLVTEDGLHGFRADRDDLYLHFGRTPWLPRVAHLPGRALVWGILDTLVTAWNHFGERRLFGRSPLADALNRGLIRRLLQRQALLAMDGATADAIDGFVGGDVRTPILALPFDGSDRRAPRAATSRPVTVLSYIGRSDNAWKIRPVRRLLRDLAQIDGRFELDVYTDDAGPYAAMIKAVRGANTDVHYHLSLYGAALRDRLSDRSDLHLSMGLSALEGALAGVPTALIDPGHADLPDHYRYRWLHDTERCTLARFVDDAPVFPGHTLMALLQAATSDRRVALATQGAEHVATHHHPDSIVRRLIATPSTWTNRDLCRWTPAAWPRIAMLAPTRLDRYRPFTL